MCIALLCRAHRPSKPDAGRPRVSQSSDTASDTRASRRPPEQHGAAAGLGLVPGVAPGFPKAGMMKTGSSPPEAWPRVGEETTIRTRNNDPHPGRGRKRDPSTAGGDGSGPRPGTGRQPPGRGGRPLSRGRASPAGTDAPSRHAAFPSPSVGGAQRQTFTIDAENTVTRHPLNSKAPTFPSRVRLVTPLPSAPSESS